MYFGRQEQEAQLQKHNMEQQGSMTSRSDDSAKVVSFDNLSTLFKNRESSFAAILQNLPLGIHCAKGAEHAIDTMAHIPSL